MSKSRTALSWRYLAKSCVITKCNSLPTDSQIHTTLNAGESCFRCRKDVQRRIVSGLTWWWPLELTGSPSTTLPFAFFTTITCWALKLMTSTGPWSIIFPATIWGTQRRSPLTLKPIIFPATIWGTQGSPLTLKPIIFPATIWGTQRGWPLTLKQDTSPPTTTHLPPPLPLTQQSSPPLTLIHQTWLTSNTWLTSTWLTSKTREWILHPAVCTCLIGWANVLYACNRPPGGASHTLESSLNRCSH